MCTVSNLTVSDLRVTVSDLRDWADVHICAYVINIRSYLFVSDLYPCIYVYLCSYLLTSVNICQYLPICKYLLWRIYGDSDIIETQTLWRLRRDQSHRDQSHRDQSPGPGRCSYLCICDKYPLISVYIRSISVHICQYLLLYMRICLYQQNFILKGKNPNV